MSSEFGHRSEAETGCKAVASVQREQNWQPARRIWIRRVDLVIKGSSLPRLARPLDVESLLQFITGARIFFRVLGVAAGISTSLSSGHAEVEEYDSHNRSLFIYAGSAFTGDLIINNNSRTIIIQPEKQYELYNTLYDDGNFNESTATQRESSRRPTHGDGIRDDLIPSTVWGLEVSDGVRFDTNYNDLRTAIHGDSIELLAADADADADGVDGLFQEIVEHFREADCGVELSERFGLKHCDVSDHTADILDVNTQIANGNDYNERPTTLTAEGEYYSGALNQIPASIENTEGTSTSIKGLSAQENSLDTVHDLSSLVDAGINTFALQGSLTDRNSAQSRCYDVDFDVSASCRTSPITVPVESKIPYYFSEPGGVSLPIVARPSVASAVPEIPTWIMFIMGFVTITLVQWKSKLNYEKWISRIRQNVDKEFLND